MILNLTSTYRNLSQDIQFTAFQTGVWQGQEEENM